MVFIVSVAVGQQLVYGCGEKITMGDLFSSLLNLRGPGRGL
jgi:hypothetical protein